MREARLRHEYEEQRRKAESEREERRKQQEAQTQEWSQARAAMEETLAGIHSKVRSARDAKKQSMLPRKPVSPEVNEAMAGRFFQSTQWADDTPLEYQASAATLARLHVDRKRATPRTLT